MPPATSTRERPRVAPAFGAAALWIVVVLLLPGAAAAQSLKGSRSSVDLQHRVALEHDFSFLSTGNRVRTFVDRGYLVRVQPSRDVDLHAVSYPYARPEVALFIDRLASQYRSACGEKLVVTSLTRPLSAQPANASDKSVHPAGMAVDIRIPGASRCRSWLEGVLLSLEKARVIEATRERRPPHYHVAVFPRQYQAYVEGRARAETRVASAAPAPSRSSAAATERAAAAAYRVRSGDSLWGIAQAHGTTVKELRSLNNLRTSRIYAGQVLEVPAAR